MALQIEEVCRKLNSDYNREILEGANDEIKEVFKDISAKYKDGKKGNIPLLNIVYNHFSSSYSNS